MVIGYIACLLIKVVPADAMNRLNWHSRTDVRLYYTWLWPLNVTNAIRRKH